MVRTRKQKPKQRHFLSHTVEHLFAVLVILMIASGVSASDMTSTSTSGPTGPLVDTLAPTPPTALVATAHSSTRIDLSWQPANDNIGVVGYKIFRNGAFMNGVTGGGTNFSDTSVLPGTSYMYYVAALDSAMNMSAPSNPANALTPTNKTGDTTASSSGTTTNTATATTPATASASGRKVEFLVQVADGDGAVNCDNGTTKTMVLLSFSPPDGGYISVHVAGGSTFTSSQDLYNVALPNGAYTWQGMPLNGAVVSGNSGGTFSLSAPNACPPPNTTAASPTLSSGTSDPTSTATPHVVTVVTPDAPTSTAPHPETASGANPLLPRPILAVFVDSIPITDPSHLFDKDEIELRLRSQLVKAVEYSAVVSNDAGPQTISLGHGTLDDLLTRTSEDVWTYMWDPEKVTNGTYKVYAHVLHTDGSIADTVPVAITIAHHDGTALPAAQGSTVGTKVSVSPEESAKILARVDDPSACSNAQECKIFCASHPEEGVRCASFARVQVSASDGATTSLADGISSERLTLLLSVQQHPQEIPLAVTSADLLRSFCATPEHLDACTKALVRGDLASMKDMEMKTEAVLSARDAESKIFSERVGARMFIDSDGDGVTDYDEINIYHTDPNDADTDHDGFPDGAEILARTNPNGVVAQDALVRSGEDGTSTLDDTRAHTSEEVRVEDPLITGVTKTEMLTVTNVTVAEVGTTTTGTTTAKKLQFSGKSLPNSFVTLFIFSDPIVVTVKTDDTGAWTYTLSKELPDGSHQVVSAITDQGGHILAKSEPLPFVKEAAAVSVGSAALVGAGEAPSFWSGSALYALLAMVLALLGIAFSVIGFIVSRRRNVDDTGGPIQPYF